MGGGRWERRLTEVAEAALRGVDAELQVGDLREVRLPRQLTLGEATHWNHHDNH